MPHDGVATTSPERRSLQRTGRVLDTTPESSHARACSMAQNTASGVAG